jgi:hypothetical protein
MWRQARPHDPLPVFGSVRRIRQEHDQLARVTNWTALSSGKADFPPSPLPGTATIVPIDSAAMLAEEGLLQRNCVGSFASRVRRGDMFVYRVFAPSRATLSLVRRDGSWRVDQLLGLANTPAPLATREAVLTWLRDTQPRRSPAARRGHGALPLSDFAEDAPG